MQVWHIKSYSFCIDLQLYVHANPYNTGPSCYSGHGRGYNGTINVTRGGLPCQRWDINYPHQHLLGYEDYPEIDGGHNYCRNPGERGDRPWCFTTDPEHRWDYCNIPECCKLLMVGNIHSMAHMYIYWDNVKAVGVYGWELDLMRVYSWESEASLTYTNSIYVKYTSVQYTL